MGNPAPIVSSQCGYVQGSDAARTVRKQVQFGVAMHAAGIGVHDAAPPLDP
jgi:hypothetical protein